MTQNHLHLLIKTVGVKSAELMECIQWSDTDCDRSNARILALELAKLTNEIIRELDQE
ncbi:MAG: hypothetical protein WBL80_09025 [Erysipelotrichaceae bacterium]